MSSSDSYAGNVHFAGEFFVAAELAKPTRQPQWIVEDALTVNGI